jgi:hypothetical protein
VAFGTGAVVEEVSTVAEVSAPFAAGVPVPAGLRFVFRLASFGRNFGSSVAAPHH